MSKEFLTALKELRKQTKKGKFNQSVDVIVNLKKINIKRTPLNLIIALPHKFKDIKVAGFLNEKSDLIDTIPKIKFDKYKEKKELRKLVKKYDFFIASANLMPAVATTFGRALGPAGKMPSPQLGIVMKEDKKSISEVLEKVNKNLKLRPTEPVIKTSIGKEDMKDEDIEKNFEAIHHAILNALPNKKENIKNILIKFTMSKPIKVSN